MSTLQMNDLVVRLKGICSIYFVFLFLDNECLAIQKHKNLDYIFQHNQIKSGIRFSNFLQKSTIFLFQFDLQFGRFVYEELIYNARYLKFLSNL